MRQRSLAWSIHDGWRTYEVFIRARWDHENVGAVCVAADRGHSFDSALNGVPDVCGSTGVVVAVGENPRFCAVCVLGMEAEGGDALRLCGTTARRRVAGNANPQLFAWHLERLVTYAVVTATQITRRIDGGLFWSNRRHSAATVLG